MHRERRFRTFKAPAGCACGCPQITHRDQTGACRIEACGCQKFRKKAGPNKLHAVRQEFNGIKCDSGLEARQAADLEYQKRAGEIRDWRKNHEVYDLIVNGIKITGYIPDFIIDRGDGITEFLETKGIWTPAALMKCRLFEALYVKGHKNVRFTIVRG
jgi:hypothetical protein